MGSFRFRKSIKLGPGVRMNVGIAAASVLTATIASKFVRDEREGETAEILQTLRRLEADVHEIKARLP
jgi:Protein of unknown function (DUF4236)